MSLLFSFEAEVILLFHLFIHDCRNSQVLLTSVCAIRVVNVPEDGRAGVCVCVWRRVQAGSSHCRPELRRGRGSVTGAEWGQEGAEPCWGLMDSCVSWWADRRLGGRRMGSRGAGVLFFRGCAMALRF